MITGIMRLSYAAIWEPKENLSGILKYSCTLLVPKSDKSTIAALQKAVKSAIEIGKEARWSGKVPKFSYEPLRDGDIELAELDSSKGPEYAGHYFLNCSSDQAPGVVDIHGSPLFNQDKLYSGCFVRADIKAFPYSHKGNKGIGWGLNNLMVVEDGKRLDGRQSAETAFADVIQTPGESQE